MKKNRVLLIATNDLGKSGVPEVIMQIVRLLHNSFTFDVIITRNNTYYKKEFESYGGKVYFLEEKEPRTRLTRFLYKSFTRKQNIHQMLKDLPMNNYSIIHSFKDLEGGIFLKEGKKYNIPIRISHCSRQYVKPKSKLSQIYNKRLLNRIVKYSTKLVAISYASGTSLFEKKHFEILYNTYDEDYYNFKEIKKQNDLVLTQIGTFLPIKNQLFSLKVIELIKKIVPNVSLQFIGRIYDEDYYNQILSYISSHNLSDNVKIFDFNQDQNTILDKTSFSLIPSISEGLSLVAIESQAKGITCFASKGVPQEVSCGNIIFSELDANLWASQIISHYNSTNSIRKKVDMSKFSNLSFKKNLMDIYMK